MAGFHFMFQWTTTNVVKNISKVAEMLLQGQMFRVYDPSTVINRNLAPSDFSTGFHLEGRTVALCEVK